MTKSAVLALVVPAVTYGPPARRPSRRSPFALAVGIVVDAFVVRLVLVPAALTLLGERAWWMPRGLRWLPALDVEGEGLRPPSDPFEHLLTQHDPARTVERSERGRGAGGTRQPAA